MCTHAPIVPSLSFYRNSAADILSAVQGSDYHAHALALQRLGRLGLDLTPDHYSLEHARDIVAREAGYSGWAELESLTGGVDERETLTRLSLVG